MFATILAIRRSQIMTSFFRNSSEPVFQNGRDVQLPREGSAAVTPVGFGIHNASSGNNASSGHKVSGSVLLELMDPPTNE